MLRVATMHAMRLYKTMIGSIVFDVITVVDGILPGKRAHKRHRWTRLYVYEFMFWVLLTTAGRQGPAEVRQWCGVSTQGLWPDLGVRSTR